ncbi:MAG: hypothetical protein ACR2QK_08820 [Acidimicrobiales bacterium]
MVLELGPWPAQDVLRWTKFARRILVELRADPGCEELVSSDVVELWSRTLDEWSRAAVSVSENEDEPFRWDSELEPEVVEFLLDGLDKCLHSPTVMGWVTPAEAEEQRAFTIRVVRAFVDGLNAEGRSCRHYADQILVSLGDLLQD